jgi:hypothetical protein
MSTPLCNLPHRIPNSDETSHSHGQENWPPVLFKLGLKAGVKPTGS